MCSKRAGEREARRSLVRGRTVRFGRGGGKRGRFRAGKRSVVSAGSGSRPGLGIVGAGWDGELGGPSFPPSLSFFFFLGRFSSSRPGVGSALLRARQDPHSPCKHTYLASLVLQNMYLAKIHILQYPARFPGAKKTHKTLAPLGPLPARVYTGVKPRGGMQGGLPGGGAPPGPSRVPPCQLVASSAFGGADSRVSLLRVASPWKRSEEAPAKNDAAARRGEARPARGSQAATQCNACFRVEECMLMGFFLIGGGLPVCASCIGEFRTDKRGDVPFCLMQSARCGGGLGNAPE